MRYRRVLVAGGTYFFTVNLADRRQSLLIDYIDNLRQSVRKTRELYPFEIIAWVVLPDHLHTIWSLPPGDTDFSMRWNRIKGAFSRSIPVHEMRSSSRTRKRERGLWQRRFWEHLIRNETDLQHHIDYIHFNPVKHGYVRRVRDWPYSTFHGFVREGQLTPDWGCSENFEGDFGEKS